MSIGRTENILYVRKNELEEKIYQKIEKGCPEYIQGDPLKLPP